MPRFQAGRSIGPLWAAKIQRRAGRGEGRKGEFRNLGSLSIFNWNSIRKELEAIYRLKDIIPLPGMGCSRGYLGNYSYS